VFPIGKVLGAAASVSLLLVACGGEPRAAEELARAKSLVQQADATNVQRYAAVELNQARDKLQAAEKADTEKQNDVARRRANEAAADAELASALARTREAEQAVTEQKRNLERLRQEATRGIPATTPNE
jgi:uncharacterized protein DUF4398